MKTLIQTLRLVLATAVLIATTREVRAALGPKAFSVSLNPTSQTVTAGTASNATATVHISEGSSLATSTNGVMLAVSVSPSGQGVTASLASSGPFTGTSGTTTLTINNTAAAIEGTYIITVTGSSTVVGASGSPAFANFTYNVWAPGSVGPGIIWTPPGANMNWSTAGNWTPAGPPGSTNDVQFFDTGAVGTAGSVNNVVNTNISIGSLTYGQTNNYHTTLIASGVTLNVGGNTNGLQAGTGTDEGDFMVTTSAITGAGGALAITNTGANVYVGQGFATANNAVSSSQAILDMSGLGSFTAAVSRLLVGVDITVRGSCGVLSLAKTNIITTPQIDVGDNNQAGGSPTIPSILKLGQTNGIYAGSIAVGRGKTDGTGASMVFNSAFSSPSAFFRGMNGSSSRVGTWTIGDGFGSRTYYTFGTCDFGLGTVNVLVDTMVVGKGASSAVGGTPNPGSGTLTFNAGTVDINTLEVGYSSQAAGTGTVNANGGLLAVNTLLELGYGSGSSGTLNISNATLTANAGIISGGGISTINLTGATLNVTNKVATIGTTASPINNLSIAGTTFHLAVPNNEPSIAAVNLACGGGVNPIHISAAPLITGFPAQFPVIKYGLNGGSASGDLSTFVLGTLPAASPAYGAYIFNNVANNSIDVVFTNGPIVPALTWDGTPNGNWDTTTANWRPNSGPNTNYSQGNFVTFDDNLTGTPNVNLTAPLSPATLTVNNSAVNYVFSGVGRISGTVTLLKSGSGTLTLNETGGDDFSGGISVANGTLILASDASAVSGGVTISGGTLQVGNNGNSGVLPAGSTVTVNSTLVFKRSDDVAVGNVIAGTGTLMQNCTNILTLTGSNTFGGTAVVAQGTLKVGSTNALGLATGVTVNSGATLDVGGHALFGNGNAGLVVTVSGVGVGGNGALINSLTNQQARVFHKVTLASDATFGGTADWDIRNSSGSSVPADAQLNGAYNLTKVGTNTVTLRGVTMDPNLGDINVRAGGLTVTATATAPLTTLGNPGATVTVFSNATFSLDSIGTIPVKNFILNNGGTLKSSGSNNFSNPLTLFGPANNTISVGSGAQFTISSAIDGSGGFSKNGSSTLFLTALNTYSGNTVISGGTLALYGDGSDGSIAASTNININSGTTLDVSGRSDTTLTLAWGQTLVGGSAGTNGMASINGILFASAGSTVAPGSGSTNLGTLTVSSNAVLRGITAMKLNAAAGTSDQLVARSIAYGGTLTVTNYTGTFTNGQSFQLFVSSNGYSGSFSTVILPAAPGLTWTNTLTTNGRITAGVTVTTPPVITDFYLSGTNFVLSGTSGTAGQQYTLMTSTNAALPLVQWTPVVTNSFTGGSFSITIPVNPTAPQNYYILRVP